jgi:hypothetical protein
MVEYKGEKRDPCVRITSVESLIDDLRLVNRVDPSAH